MRRAALLLIIVTTTSTAAAEPVLHEYVKPPRGRGGRIVSPEPSSPGKTPTENPAAIRHGDDILVAPPAAEPERPSEVVHGEQGFAADRDTEARPDYATGADGTLHYVEVWNPSIVPFKRMSALDAVRPDYTLAVSDAPRVAVPSGGDTSPDRDLFWGSLVVKLPRGGEAIAIPSVAPEMRILSYETEPKVKLAFERDAGDNFWVRAADPRAGGQLRLVFLVDAPATYFAPRVPSGVTLRAVAAGRAAAPLPPRVRAAARTILGHLGITPSMDAGAVLDRLIAHFRAFEAGTPPAPSGDVYLDLSLSQTGVCRHRAFAFMITANAAGIPARYVTNEAHAFAEVWLPGGWLRVDLGGAALELEVANASDKTMHRPRSADPFPKPREYADNYTRLRGPVEGLSRDQIADATRPAEPAEATAASDPTSTDPVAARSVDLPRAAAAEPADTRRRIPLVIDTVDRKAFRGEVLRIHGHAGDGGGPEGLRVDIYLAPAGSRGEGARAVGQTATDADGKFSVAVELPLDVLLGSYEVYAVTPGNGEIAPGVSE